VAVEGLVSRAELHTL